jgi:hypothetical protein
MRRITVQFAVLASPVAAAAVLVAPGSVFGAPTPTKVTISKHDPRFHGRVTADRRACVADRRIRLFHEYNKEDVLVAKTRTDKDGKWKIHRPGAKIGIYYVKANRVKTESGAIKCGPGRSETVFISS